MYRPIDEQIMHRISEKLLEGMHGSEEHSKKVLLDALADIRAVEVIETQPGSFGLGYNSYLRFFEYIEKIYFGLAEKKYRWLCDLIGEMLAELPITERRVRDGLVEVLSRLETGI